jgi:hypothetical protein
MFCRLCLSKKRNMIDIFGREGQNLQIDEIITEHFGFQVLWEKKHASLDGRLRMGCRLTLANLRLFWSLIVMRAWWCLTCFWARRRSRGVMLWLTWGLRRFVPRSILRCIDCVCYSSWLKRVRLKLCKALLFPYFFYCDVVFSRISSVDSRRLQVAFNLRRFDYLSTHMDASFHFLWITCSFLFFQIDPD